MAGQLGDVGGTVVAIITVTLAVFISVDLFFVSLFKIFKSNGLGERRRVGICFRSIEVAKKF